MDWTMVGEGLGGITALLLLGWGGYLWVGFASRKYFEQRERHIERVLKLTEQNGGEK